MITGKSAGTCKPVARAIRWTQIQQIRRPALKFHQLRIGARFEHKGTRFRKISPLKAVGETDELHKLIPRSAAVILLDDQGQPAEQRLPDTLATGRVEAELDRLVTECLAAAGRLQPPLTGAQQEQFERAARSAAQDLLTRLAIDG
jgi:hypothetical protein